LCSIISKNEISLARALFGNLRSHHPRAALYVLLLDRADGRFRPDAEPFTVVPLEELPLSDLPRLCFLRTAAELCCAVKPHLLRHLFQKYGVRKLVYCDPDVLILRNLGHLERLLDRQGVVITPLPAGENVSYPGPSRGADDPSLLALTRGKAALDFLDWWECRTGRGGPEAAESDPFAVRGWVDSMPGFFRRRTRPAGLGWPYTWSFFDNGVAITDRIRRCYLRLGPEAAGYGNPFVTAGSRSFFSWLTSCDGATVLPYLQEFYDERPDLRHNFPDVTGKDRTAYLNWAVTQGVQESHLDPVLVAKVRAAVGKPREPLPVLAGGRGGPVTASFGVNVLGRFRSEKGVGEHSRGTVRALLAARVPCVLNDWEDPGSANVDDTFTDFTTDNPYPVNLIHVNAVDAPWLAREIPWYFKGRYNIGYWNWELEWFPEEWQGSYQYFDEIWAASAFTQKSIARLSPVPVYWVSIPVCPPGADAARSRASSVTRGRFGIPAGAFAFLFAFDFSSLMARKNPLAVVEAFRRAFPTRRDVVLVLKVVHWKSAPEFGEMLAACRGQPNIRFVRDVLSRDEMYGLMRLCDAYVGLHRSEGFGLPLAEAMALGKPVIATNYSSNVDFMNEANSFPVRYRLVTIEQDYGPYRRGAVWADADVAHAAEQMRRVVDDPENTARVSAQARADMARHFSPHAVGQQMLARLTAILHGRQVAGTTVRERHAA
jgi:glycosyltransferase involved in cell wall biosynthesis